MKKQNKIINQIQKVRSINNINWMKLLKIAIKSSPKETKLVIKKISINDKKITKLVNILSKIK